MKFIKQDYWQVSRHIDAPTIKHCEKRYNLDVYMFPMNMLGFVYPEYEGNETVKERIDLIKSVNKQFII